MSRTVLEAPRRLLPEALPPGRAGRMPTGRGAWWRLAVTVLAVLAVAAGIAALSIEGARQHESAVPVNPVVAARDAAATFLDRYVARDGRVVRRDQGGDTVSEGQAYALLLDVALGRRSQFATVWRWERTDLELPDGLFSYRWAHGRVVGVQPATDADLETAWALALGAHRFGDAAYRAEALRVAHAVLADETVVVGGALELVAGPWAVHAPYEIDPSYLAPEAMAVLATATHDARWAALERDSVALERSFEGGATPALPPNWGALAGTPHAAGAPSTRSAPAYGLDAERVPVLYAASCLPAARVVAKKAWPLLDRSEGRGSAISYSLDGRRLSKLVSPLGGVAAAAAARADGLKAESTALLDWASGQAAAVPTYYGDAWVALGRVLLDTDLLGSCPVPH